MRRWVIQAIAAAVCIWLIIFFGSATHGQPAAASIEPSEVRSVLSSVPLSFTSNTGQWNERALFQAKAGGATAWLTHVGVYHQFTRWVPSSGAGALSDNTGSGEVPAFRRGTSDQISGRFEQLSIKSVFAGANPRPQVSGEVIMPHKSSYFIGLDSTAWRTDVPSYRRVLFQDIYPGIDLKYYGRGHLLEYDFIVSPGADYTQIQIEYEGAESLAINPNGELVIGTAWGEVTECVPVVYQDQANGRLQIAAEYELISENSFGFRINDSYNPAAELIIDPVLTYSTFLGGNGSDEGLGVVTDDVGNAYIVGYCLSDDFPAQDPYQTDMGGYDVFVSKLNAAGNGLIYSTYLGGDDDDWGSAIALDADGNTYITGHTSSEDFPTQNPYQSELGGEGDDAFVAKLNSAGNGLVFCTYLGGDDEDRGHAIAVGENGGPFVTGYTSSIDFPTQNPYQTHQGGRDAFVTHFNASGDGLVYGTYLGGSDYEEGRGIAVDDDGQAHVVGYTSSGDFPVQIPYQVGYRGGSYDVFVTKLNSPGDALLYSTYLGGTGEDQGRAVALDDSGNTYLTGYTGSSDFPTVTSYQTYQGSLDAFVTKITPVGDALVYSTYLGGDGYEEGLGIAVNICGGAYVTGSTSSTDFPTVNPLQATFQGGGYDAFAASLNLAGDGLVYGTYLGGGGQDLGYGIAVDPVGIAYLTGYTASSDMPTENPLQAVLG